MVTESKYESEASSLAGNCHFEYSLRSEEREIEGNKYIGYGVSVRMVDADQKETTAYINDITAKRAVAESLIHWLNVSKVSPDCLRAFTEDFLAKYIDRNLAEDI